MEKCVRPTISIVKSGHTRHRIRHRFGTDSTTLAYHPLAVPPLRTRAERQTPRQWRSVALNGAQWRSRPAAAGSGRPKGPQNSPIGVFHRHLGDNIFNRPRHPYAWWLYLPYSSCCTPREGEIWFDQVDTRYLIRAGFGPIKYLRFNIESISLLLSARRSFLLYREVQFVVDSNRKSLSMLNRRYLTTLSPRQGHPSLGKSKTRL